MTPHRSYGLWVIIMGSHRVFSCYKSTTLMGVVDNGESYAHVDEVCRKSLYLHLNVDVNLKLL